MTKTNAILSPYAKSIRPAVAQLLGHRIYRRLKG